MMWRNKNPPLTVFMDKETRLKIPPDILGVWRYLPFRNDVFDCVIFDPPHSFKRGSNSWFGEDPAKTSGLGFWYGAFKNKFDCLTSIISAQREFNRVSKRLCFKWHTGDLEVEKMIPLFDKWIEIHTLSKSSRGIKKMNRTVWITFVRKQN